MGKDTSAFFIFEMYLANSTYFSINENFLNASLSLSLSPFLSLKNCPAVYLTERRNVYLVQPLGVESLMNGLMIADIDSIVLSFSPYLFFSYAYCISIGFLMQLNH